MKEVNLPPFFIGELVVCIGPVSNLIKHEQYIVTALDKCSGCGLWYVGVDNIPNKEKLLIPGCGKCNHRMPNYPSMAMWQANRFATINKNFQSISLEKILETETKLIGVN